MRFNDLVSAVLHNDTDEVEATLIGLRLPEKIVPTDEDEDIITTILGFTSNLARHDKLSDEMAMVVINHTTIAIDEIKFIELVVGGSLDISTGALKTLVDFYISDAAAIPRYVYEKGIIAPDIMFAYMGLCLLKGNERHRVEDVEAVVQKLLL